jgi:hypothetical protein
VLLENIRMDLGLSVPILLKRTSTDDIAPLSMISGASMVASHDRICLPLISSSKHHPIP